MPTSCRSYSILQKPTISSFTSSSTSTTTSRMSCSPTTITTWRMTAFGRKACASWLTPMPRCRRCATALSQSATCKASSWPISTSTTITSWHHAAPYHYAVQGMGTGEDGGSVRQDAAPSSSYVLTVSTGQQ